MEKGREYLDMTVPEQLDCFFSDTFISHTKSHRCTLFPVIMDCYEQWCDVTGCAPLATPHLMGRSLANRFFKKNLGGRKHWFLEIRGDLLEEDT